MTGEAPSGGRTRVLLIMGEVFADGGIQRFNRTFIRACARLDVVCDVLALNDGESSRMRSSVPQSANISVFGRRRVPFALATINRLVRGRYDVVVIGHVNLLTLVVAALAPRRWAPIRTLLIAHGIEVWTSIVGRRRRAIRAIDTVLCVSHYTAEMIKQQAPEMPTERLSIFPNALSESWTGRFKQASGIEERRSLPTRFFLSVTRLDKADRYKGIATSLEAFAMLEDQALHYVIAGHGDDMVFLKEVAERLQVSERVHFLGTVSDAELADLYRTCIAFVLPSGKEGFGIVFLEAMYFGAPVIAAAAKGALDVVRHEHTGLLVPYGDSVALKNAMNRLVHDTALCDRLRVEASRMVNAEGQFTFGAYVRRLAMILGAESPVSNADETRSRDAGQPLVQADESVRKDGLSARSM
jgi:phosphatidylinositol alpha-1,6-mannosyltransferase